MTRNIAKRQTTGTSLFDSDSNMSQSTRPQFEDPSKLFANITLGPKTNEAHDSKSKISSLFSTVPHHSSTAPVNLLSSTRLDATRASINQSSVFSNDRTVPEDRGAVIFGTPAPPTAYNNPAKSLFEPTRSHSEIISPPLMSNPFTPRKIVAAAGVKAPSLFNPQTHQEIPIKSLEESRLFASTASIQDSDRISVSFEQILQQRLDEIAVQLETSVVSQGTRWYLESEISRLKDKLQDVSNESGGEKVKVLAPEAYTQPFCDFLTENPTVFHAVDHFGRKLNDHGFKRLSERALWTSELEKGGKYFVERNGSSLIAFTIGKGYKSGNGVAMIAGHVDALTARLKPVSAKKTTAGYVQLGVAPYAGGLNTTWWDRDLTVGGRVLVKDSKTGKINSKLVKLGWPIARIPTLAPHFGVGMLGQNNAETQAVPIIGLDNSDVGGLSGEDKWSATILGGVGSFTATQPPKLVKAIAGELSIQDYSSIINWELELYDSQPAQVGGLDKEFIFAGRVDDKLCSWSAIEGLLAASPSSDSGIVNLVGLFDDEEIGSLLRQGARGNFLPSVVERITEAFSETGSGANLLSQTYANSFLVSADVTHAVNPNFLGSYLENHAPRLNVGLVVSADSNGHMTTDSVSTALLTRIAEKSDSKLQLFMIRNDSRSGGTVGPMLSSAMGVRAIDAGIPQLSMHSIRATTGALDPGLGVKLFAGFFDHFEEVDKEFE